MPTTSSLPFVKMNGLGNDFIIIDTRGMAFDPPASLIAKWADRNVGIGCDQVIAIENAAEADAFMRVWNADGSLVETCGNALRCVAFFLDQGEKGKLFKIDTLGGRTSAQVLRFTENSATVTVDMGHPRLRWDQIPISEEMDTGRLELQVGPIDAPLYHTPVAVNMGNPHVVFFVKDMALVDVARTGSLIEHHPLFPEGVNVEFAQVIDHNTVRMRVWERGAGITKACGTGACATLVAAVRRGLTQRSASIIMDGGSLMVHWADNDHVFMTGPAVREGGGLLS
jgi:diaminopimelate epimerase